jgi:hypothetical protein
MFERPRTGFPFFRTVAERLGRRRDQKRNAALGDAFDANGVHLPWDGSVPIATEDVLELLRPLEGRGRDLMHRLGDEPVESECRLEAHIGRAIDACRETIGVNPAPRRVEPSPELEDLSCMDHPGDLSALIARVPQPLLQPKGVNDQLRLKAENVHRRQDSCTSGNYQDGNDSIRIIVSAGRSPATRTPSAPIRCTW